MREKHVEGFRTMIDWKDLAERVLSTFVQAAGGMLGTNALIDMNVAEWKLVLGAGGAAVLSMLKGYFAARFTADGSASLIVGKDQDHELDAMYGES
tara:strand:+ start:20 stop:307 length:288 start_codon:yes stop_codon:yes gene_type:complete